jgi:hypothetical protein
MLETGAVPRFIGFAFLRSGGSEFVMMKHRVGGMIVRHYTLFKNVSTPVMLRSPVAGEIIPEKPGRLCHLRRITAGG